MQVAVQFEIAVHDLLEARIIDGIAFYLVGAIIVWNDSATRQRLGDKAAKTVVLEKDDEPMSVNPQGHVEQTPGLGFKEAAGAPLPNDETPQPPQA